VTIGEEIEPCIEAISRHLTEQAPTLTPEREDQKIAATEPEQTPPPLSDITELKPDAPAASKPRRRALPPEAKAARALVRAHLAKGPKPGAQVEAAAAAAGLAKRSLLAATDALGVRTQRGQWWLPG